MNTSPVATSGLICLIEWFDTKNYTNWRCCLGKIDLRSRRHFTAYENEATIDDLDAGTQRRTCLIHV